MHTYSMQGIEIETLDSCYNDSPQVPSAQSDASQTPLLSAEGIQYAYAHIYILYRIIVWP